MNSPDFFTRDALESLKAVGDATPKGAAILVATAQVYATLAVAAAIEESGRTYPGR